MLKNIHLNKKKALIAAGIAVGVLAAVYIGFSVFFMNHFFFRTTINGIPVSGCTADKVQKQAEDSIKGYALSISGRDGVKEEIKGEDVGLEAKTDGKLEALLKEQNGFAWPAKLFSPEKLTSKTLVSYDEGKLKNAVAALDCMDEANQVEPADAHISDYDAKNGYTVVDEVEGNALDADKVDDVIEKAVSGLSDSVDLDKESCYKEPQVRSDDKDLQSACDKVNSYLKSSITYQVGDKGQTLDASTFGSWISLDENLEPVIDQNAVADYVSELSSTYNTCNGTKSFKTSYGTTVEVGNVHYGWKVDKDAEAAAIVSDIESGKAVTRDLNYSMTAASHGANDYGDSYVEINLTGQHLFLYKNGSLVLESDVVTGKTDGSHETPPGVFGITYCERNATLRGANYATPVAYWMPFNGDIGLHDATWQPAFGGTLYTFKGSHGCVNLPLGVAKTIFENVEAGFPVICYDLPGTEHLTSDQQAAADFDSAAAAIGTVTLESEPAITAARAKYESLSSLAKKYAKGLDTLTAAEDALNQLKAQQQTDPNAADPAAQPADQPTQDGAAQDAQPADQQPAADAPAEDSSAQQQPQ